MQQLDPLTVRFEIPGDAQRLVHGVSGQWMGEVDDSGRGRQRQPHRQRAVERRADQATVIEVEYHVTDA